MCACPPGDCPDIWTTETNNGATVVMEVGQWIALALPGPSIAVTASSNEPSVLKLVGQDRHGNFGRGDTVYMSFNAVKAGSAQLTFGYQDCDAASAGRCSYVVNVRVVQFPKTAVPTVSLDDSPTPAIELRVGQSARFGGCCEYSVEELNATIDQPSVVQWAVEPFVTLQGVIEGAITAASPGTAHVHGVYCRQTSGSSCPSVWSLTVVVT